MTTKDDKIESLQGEIKRSHSRAASAVESASGGMLALLTGAVVGGIRAKRGDSKFMGVEGAGIAGIIAHGFAIYKPGNKMAYAFRAIGNAGLGIAACDMAEQKVKEWDEDKSADGVGARGRKYVNALGEGVRKMADTIEGNRETGLVYQLQSRLRLS